MTFSTPRIGYLIGEYPRRTETVVTHEILQLEDLGLEVVIFSLKTSNDTVSQANVSKIRFPVQNLSARGPLMWPMLWFAHVLAALQDSRGYLRALCDAIGCCSRSSNLSNLAPFLQAGFLAGRGQKLQGITHFHAQGSGATAKVSMYVNWMTGTSFSFSTLAKCLASVPSAKLRQLMKHASFAVTSTQCDQDGLRELAAGTCPVYLLHHTVDTRRFSRETQSHIVPLHKRAAPDEPPLLISVGALVQEKGFDTLLRSCAILHKNGLRFHCLIFGTGREHRPLVRLSRELGVQGCVQFPGEVLQGELIQLYGRAHVFALPCRELQNGLREGMPAAILEAQSMELPVVSTRMGGVAELIQDGYNGYLVAPDDPEELAIAIAMLMNDAPLRREMGRAARLRVAERSTRGHNSYELLRLFLQACGMDLCLSGATRERDATLYKEQQC